MEDLQEICDELKNSLDKKQQGFICLKSFQNFLIFLHLLNHGRQKAQSLLENYSSFIKNLDYPIDFGTCKIITVDYVMPLGRLFRDELDFKIQPALSGVFFWGLQVDLLLLLFGVLQRIYFVPITTCLLLADWSHRKIFYETKNKTYGGEY